MPLFYYKGRDKTTHKPVNGTIEAKDQAEAIKKLRNKGVLILSVGSDHSLHMELAFLNRVSVKDRIIFIRQLAVMLKAGLPIVPAVKAIEEQSNNKAFQTVLGNLRKEVEGGTPLSQAFAHYPQAFPAIFSSVTQIGEKSGKLDDVLERLATQLEKDDDLVSRTKGAMIYPIFVLSALVVVMILIMVYIIPQLKGLFVDAGVGLPLVTRILLGVSEWMQHNILFIAIGAVIAVGVIKFISARSLKVRLFLEQIRFHLPIFGKLYRQTLMARFSHTMATLLKAGLPMLESLKTCAIVLNSPNYTKSINTIGKEIESGRPLSESLLKDKAFAPMIGHMVSTGEASGNLDQVLETVAGFFDKEVDTLTRNLSTLLEPLLMLIMGLGVGLVVASVIMPIYNLVNAV